MAIDLSGVQEFVEQELMTDTVIVTRDSEQYLDDVWDPVEGTLLPPAEDEYTVYQGECYISSSGNVPKEEVQGGQNTNETWYYLNIPLLAPVVKDSDKVLVLTCLRDPLLVGSPFLVQEDQRGTFKVKRKIRMRRLEPAK